MTQIVFIYGPGAGGCAESFVHQLKHYPDSLAPTLPGHLEGKPCPSVERYTEWLREWLHAKGKQRELVLVGFTVGACIALRYGLDYPDEVKALVLMTIAMRPKERPRGALELRLKAAQDAEMYRKWLDLMRHNMMFIDPCQFQVEIFLRCRPSLRLTRTTRRRKRAKGRPSRANPKIVLGDRKKI
jgi:pimeloyl-ACP methyl ester carboxylesterase